jgi:hypothetical protein
MRDKLSMILREFLMFPYMQLQLNKTNIHSVEETAADYFMTLSHQSSRGIKGINEKLTTVGVKDLPNRSEKGYCLMKLLPVLD